MASFLEVNRKNQHHRIRIALMCNVETTKFQCHEKSLLRRAWIVIDVLQSSRREKVVL